MTSDNILKFLGNREYLHQVSYQELKSLVVQYPYSLSLRYLLAMKSHQEDHQDHDRNLELLATYGIDRAYFHKIFSEEPIILEDLEESLLIREDFLELKELSTLERELDEKLITVENTALSFIKEENSLTSIIETPSPLEETPDIIEENTEETLVSSPIVLEEIEEEKVEMEPAIIGEAIPDTNIEVPAIPKKKENEIDLTSIETVDFINAEFTDDELDQLFEIDEEETIKEEAVSDSFNYVEHPEEVLDTESKKALEESLEDTIDPSKESETIKRPDIPFDIIIPNEEIQKISNSNIEEETEKEEIGEAIINIQEATPTKIELLEIKKFDLSIFSQAPAPKSIFTSWQNHYGQLGQLSSINFLPITNDLNDKGRIIRRKRKKIKAKYKATVDYAANSLKMDEDIASETLAQLLFEQGHYDRALSMYEELCLIIPEKSIFFADQIKKIQNLQAENP